METVLIGDVMHEKQQFVRTHVYRFKSCGHGGRILADKSCSCRDGAVHTDALLVGTMPLTPAVTFGRPDAWPIMDTNNMGQRSGAQRTRVLFIGGPGCTPPDPRSSTHTPHSCKAKI